MTAKLQILIDWYDKYIIPELINNDLKLKQIFHSNNNDSTKALAVLIGKDNWYVGCHQWYLRCFHPQTLKAVLKKIESEQPWLKINNINDFESLFKMAKKMLNHSFITQLTWYDLALHLYIISNNNKLLPHKYIYVHALPMVALKWLRKKGYLSKGILKNGNLYSGCTQNGSIIDVACFKNAFGNMESRHIEDLLCYIAKSLRRIKNGQPGNNQRDKEFDQLIKKL